jgi:hypothetical protein
MLQSDSTNQANSTEENNSLSVRLIANFMGWENSPFHNLPNKVYTQNFEIGKHLDQFKYHESWDELMPVYKKIRVLLDTLERPSKNHCCKGDSIEVDIHCALLSIDILKVNKYVIEFIEWWNASEFNKAKQ